MPAVAQATGSPGGAEPAAMRRAVELGRSVLGATSPNPPVGAVVLDTGGRVVGEGATSPPGGPHAEVHALRAAEDRARGGTLVCTLEPCAHTGRTGPCTEAILTAGIRRVVYGVADPTPVAAGGAEWLRERGLDVVGDGVFEAQAIETALRGWMFAFWFGRPLVIWKYAATLDGRVAAADGTSRWITGREAREDVHRLRGECDAIVVGSGTALADDPRLTVRTPEGPVRRPLRVVLDRRGRLPGMARVRDDAAPTLVLDAPDPAAAVADLFDRGVRSVLLEGGPTLAGAFVAAGLVDRVVAYLAPALLGAGPTALGSAGMDTIGAALRLQVDDVTQLGQDLRVTAFRL